MKFGGAESGADVVLDIDHDDQVLEPRPWTAAQSLWAAELLETAPPGPVLELCAGVGHIGLLAIALRRRPLVAVDLNPVACDFLRTNAERAGLAELVEVREGDMEGAVRTDERFALVIADPPWVEHDAIGQFPEDPTIAIDGGPDGLVVARLCLRVIARSLLEGGSAVLQLGDTDQVEQLRDPATRLGLALGEVRSYERGVLVRVDHPR